MKDLPRYTVTYCFSGNMKFITKEGTYTFREMKDRVVDVLTDNGWEKASVNYHGKQELVKLTVSRSGRLKKIFTTAEHKWFVTRLPNTGESCPKQIYKTTQLQKGMMLEYSYPEKHIPTSISTEYIAMGIVYGDGYVLRAKEKKRKHDVSIASLYEHKQELEIYFDGFGLGRNRGFINGCKCTKIHKLPKEWKTEIPNINTEKNKIYSWLIGYFATDGSVSKAGQCTLSSSKKDELLKVKDLFMILGIGTSTLLEYQRKGYNDFETSIYSITIMKTDITEEFFILNKHKKRFENSQKPKHQPRRWSVVSVENTGKFEDVYCCEVNNKSHSFTLEDGILTHNCQYGDERMKPTDIWTNHPSPNFKPICKNGDPCHVPAPRGSKTGTQGRKGSIERSLIPEELCDYIVHICEN